MSKFMSNHAPLLLLCLFSSAGLAEEAVPPPAAPAHGSAPVTAIEVCKPQGEREYLSHLVCPSGNRPAYERAGSVGTRNPMPANPSKAELNQITEADLTGRKLRPGETDYHVIDKYEVVCSKGDEKDKTILYLDMYHCHDTHPAVAPEGFTLGD